jgi:adenylate kinase
MRMLIMGAPGAGKGTMASIIKEFYHIPHISTGDMFREAMKISSPVGLTAKQYIEKGELVPDEVTIRLVEERLREEDAQHGFLFDGFPRTLSQAQALDTILSLQNVKLDVVVDMRIDRDLLIKRLSGRRVCSQCNANYHIENLKPKVEGICDRCGSPLIHRKDDTEETIHHRLAVYEENTLPLIAYYEAKGLVVAAKGYGNTYQSFCEIEPILGAMHDYNQK